MLKMNLGGNKMAKNEEFYKTSIFNQIDFYFHSYFNYLHSRHRDMNIL